MLGKLRGPAVRQHLHLCQPLWWERDNLGVGGCLPIARWTVFYILLRHAVARRQGASDRRSVTSEGQGSPYAGRAAHHRAPRGERVASPGRRRLQVVPAPRGQLGLAAGGHADMSPKWPKRLRHACSLHPVQSRVTDKFEFKRRESVDGVRMHVDELRKGLSMSSKQGV